MDIGPSQAILFGREYEYPPIPFGREYLPKYWENRSNSQEFFDVRQNLQLNFCYLLIFLFNLYF